MGGAVRRRRRTAAARRGPAWARRADVARGRADAAVDAFLRQRVRRSTRRTQRALTKLGPPPYLDPRSFQRRAVLLTGFDSIERGRTFNQLLRETLVAMLRTYGVLGTARALRNMNIVQRQLLPEVESLDLLAHRPQLGVPVHFVFGGQ